MAIELTTRSLKSLRYLLGSLDTLVSKSFLGYQSRSSYVVQDAVHAVVNGTIRRGPFRIVSGRTDTPVPTFDEALARGRGNSAASSSQGYTTDIIPSAFHDIISKHRAEIEAYVGKAFLCERPLCFRNLGIPDEYKTYDVYSNIWHQDSHDGNRLLKIFVLLMDVTEEDGPFCFLDRDATLQHWPALRERWTFEKMKVVPAFSEERRAIGPRGSYLILDTASCMHRASIPKGHRDMMQLTLYPSWRKTPQRVPYTGC